jgi:hypothetical protein
MRPTEAQWIAAQLADLTKHKASPLLNIGSSTAEFRTVKQPHIESVIFAPLRRQGIEVIHTDLKQEPGVDVAGDLMDPAVGAVLRAKRPKAALSSNLLEHVRDPAAFVRTMVSLVEPGGHVIVTVPCSYPFHADPIDTGFRPTPTELSALFPGCTQIRADLVTDVTYARELLGQSKRRALKSLVGALLPTGDVARARRDRLRWLFRPFTTSCVVMQTPA